MTTPQHGLSEQSRAARATRIGASEVGAVAGISPYASPFDVWRRLVLGEQQPETERMQLGAQLEATIVRLWAAREGLEVRRNRYTRVRGHLAATVDGFILGPAEHELAGALLEVKLSANPGMWGEVPPHVRMQAVAQAHVYRRRRVVVVVLLNGTELRSWLVEPDRDERRGVVAMVDAYYAAHIETASIPLPWLPHDLAGYLRILQGLAPDERRAATDAEQLCAEQYLAARREASALKSVADGARTALLEAIRLDPRRRIVGDGWAYDLNPETGRITISDTKGSDTE